MVKTMKQQNSSIHVQYYAPHHFVFYPIILFLFIFSFRASLNDNGNKTLWWFVTAIIFLIGWLAFMLRQHYALTHQNRIVRLEMRYRYYRLTQQNFEPLELKLSFNQIAALRFAGDEELLALTDRALKEALSPQKIKQSITNWVPDNVRV
jgi:hypothetical protein